MRAFNLLQFINIILHIVSLSYILGTAGFFTLTLIKTEDKFSSLRFLKGYTDYLPFFFLLFIITDIAYIISSEKLLIALKTNSYVKVLIKLYIPFLICSILVGYHLYKKLSKLTKINFPILINKEWWKIRVDISVIMEFFFVILIIEALLVYLVYFD